MPESETTICQGRFHAFIWLSEDEETETPENAICECGNYRYRGDGLAPEYIGSGCPVCFKEWDDHIDAIRCVVE